MIKMFRIILDTCYIVNAMKKCLITYMSYNMFNLSK